MIRYGIDKDFEKAKKIWSECFLDSPEEVEFYFENLYDKHKYLVLEEDDEIKASLHENPYKLNINGTIFDSQYIVGVAVSPEYRGRGYMGELIKESLSEARKRGIPFVYLSPINPEIYRKYGFEYTNKLCKYSLDTKDLLYIKIEKAYDIKRVELNSDDEIYGGLVEIYKEKMKDCFLYVERDEKYYRDWVREIKSDGGEIYVIYLGEEPRGYLAFYKDKNIVVREIFSKDRRALENLLAFLRTFKEYYPKIEIKNPLDSNLEMLFSNHKIVKKEEFPFIMGRVVNPYEILKILNIYNIEMKIMITDSIIPENNGVYIFNQDGELTFEKEGQWDLKIDIGDFSLLVFGVLSLDELIFLEKLEIKNNAIIKNLKIEGIFNIKRNYIQDYQ